METLGFVAVAAVALTSTLVGGRLLLISRRTRGFPEFVLGLSLVGITGVGFPIVLLTELRATLGPHLTLAADLVGSFVVAFSFAGFYVFTWRVFRPRAGWATATTAVGSATMLVATGATVWLAIGTTTSEEKYLAVRGPEIVLFASAAMGFLWSAVEAFPCYIRLRRRCAIGLAQPVVANRVLLWGLTGLAASGGLGILTALRLLDVNYLSAPVALFTIAGCGFLVSALLSLAFLPPPAYLRWIEATSRS